MDSPPTNAERVEIDVDERRDRAITLNGLTRVDDRYTFYYDETNNPRRLRTTPAGFNVETPLVFVLGGVAHRGEPRPLDIGALRSAVHLQPGAAELKRENLGKGDFLRLLGHWKVEAFLDWVWGEDLLIHYIAVDPLYWAIVDIVDSVISHDHLAHLQAIHWQLKNDLFALLAADWPDAATLFHAHDYPNVGQAGRVTFIEGVRERLETRRSRLNDFSYQMLKGVLEAGAKVDTLIYLEDEEPHTLIDSFAAFFIERLCLFKNAAHRLDVEEVIQEKLAGFVFKDGTDELRHFSFVDSKAEPGVQISDVMVGLLGKFFSYACRTEPAQLVRDRRGLTPGQVRTLGKLNRLLDRANGETPALTQQIASLGSMQAGRFFLEGR